MRQTLLPILLWILEVGDEDLKNIPEITRLDIMDGATTEFHREGLFSTDIFGPVGSPARDVSYGKINLKVHVLHPLAYEKICALKDLYRQILHSETTAIWDDVNKDFVASKSSEAQTGYSFFMSHFYDMEFKRNKSKARNDRINFLQKYKDHLEMKNLVVQPAGLRDVEIEDGRPVKGEVNDFYARVLSATRTLVTTNDMSGPEYDTVRKVLTTVIYDLYRYFARLLEGKKGFTKDNFTSRRIHGGTRAVLTSMDTSGLELDSPNTPPFESTVIGLHQAAVAYSWKVIYNMKNTLLSHLISAGEGEVPVVDPKTLRRTYVDITPEIRDKWMTDEGLREVINSLVVIESRNQPIYIGDGYLSLIYKDDKYFRIFGDIDELPSHLDKKNVYPITLGEMIYLSMYHEWYNLYGFAARYPINHEDSNYPTRVYLKTTSVGEVKRELDEFWKPKPGDEFLAVEFPKSNFDLWHSSLSPHPSRLRALGADFDGDTGSLTSIVSNDAIEEVKRYLDTREAWVKADGTMRASINYDTLEAVFYNLSGRFNHVSNA